MSPPPVITANYRISPSPNPRPPNNLRNPRTRNPEIRQALCQTPPTHYPPKTPPRKGKTPPTMSYRTDIPERESRSARRRENDPRQAQQASRVCGAIPACVQAVGTLRARERVRRQGLPACRPQVQDIPRVCGQEEALRVRQTHCPPGLLPARVGVGVEPHGPGFASVGRVRLRLYHRR